jgi:hypothetical protein
MLVAGVVALTLLIAPAAIAGEDQDLAELESLTGLDTMFDELTGGFATGAQHVITDERYLTAWQGALKEAFVPAAMRGEMFKVFPGALTDADRAALLQFYRSDFGRRISGLEAEAHGADPASVHQVAQRDFEAATPERRQLVRDLLDAVNSEAAKQMFVESLRSMVMAAVLTSTKGVGPIPWDQINGRVDQIAPGMLAALDNEMQLQSTYAYRDLSDGDMQRYIDFLKSEPAQKFYGLVIYGSAMVTDHAMTTLGTSFATRLNQLGA